MTGHGNLPPEMDDLANEIGDIICYWGFKKIHGRLWTHVYLSEEPLDAGQLMQRLKVSKALISLSINDLLRQEVIIESAKSARGTQTYIANPKVLDVIQNVLRRREQKMLSRTEACCKTLSEMAPENLKNAQLEPLRVQSLSAMIGQATAALDALMNLQSVDFQSWSILNDGKTR